MKAQCSLQQISLLSPRNSNDLFDQYYPETETPLRFEIKEITDPKSTDFDAKQIVAALMPLDNHRFQLHVRDWQPLPTEQDNIIRQTLLYMLVYVVQDGDSNETFTTSWPLHDIVALNLKTADKIDRIHSNAIFILMSNAPQTGGLEGGIFSGWGTAPTVNVSCAIDCKPCPPRGSKKWWKCHWGGCC